MLTLTRMTKTEPAYTPPDWSTGTDQEIVNALEKHYAGSINLYEYWNVGAEREVLLSAVNSSIGSNDHNEPEQYITLVLSEKGGKMLSDGTTECVFQVDMKEPTQYGHTMNSTLVNANWKNCERRDWLNTSFKNALPATLRGAFKQFINPTTAGGGSTTVENTMDTFALRSEIEIYGSRTYSSAGEGYQIDRYKTSANRPSGQVWSRSPLYDDPSYFGDISSFYDCYITYGQGTPGFQSSVSAYPLLVFGCI